MKGPGCITEKINTLHETLIPKKATDYMDWDMFIVTLADDEPSEGACRGADEGADEGAG